VASIARAEALPTTMRISITWVSHQVDPIEIEEMLFGIDGEEEPRYLMTGDGNGYVVLGQTPDGRFLKLYGEYVVSEPDGQSLFRPVGCIDMTPNDRRRFKEHLK
jgi:hypothetical protein